MSNVVSFDCSGLACTLYPGLSAQSQRLAIICHGFGSSQDSSKVKAFQSALHKNGYAVLTFDFAGHGKSLGSFRELTISACVRNLKAIVGWASSHGFKQISLVGYSFGGLICSLVAAKDNRLHALVLVNPLSDYAEKEELLGRTEELATWKERGERLFDIHHSRLPLSYEFYTDSLNHSAYAIAGSIRIPMRIIHSEYDEMVPIAQSIKFADISNQSLKIVKGADHRLTNPESLERVAHEVVAFIEQSYNG